MNTPSDIENMLNYLELRRENHPDLFYTISFSYDGNRVILVCDTDETTSYVYDNDGNQIKEVYHRTVGLPEEVR